MLDPNKPIKQLIEENDAFCILPWTNFIVSDGKHQLCCMSNFFKSEYDPSVEFHQDPERNQIKQQMLQGQKVPQCDICYKREGLNLPSKRKLDTVRWLKDNSESTVKDLDSITEPTYYEMRTNNICNLACRICSPEWSSVIDQENKKSKIYELRDYKYVGFEAVNLDTAKVIGVAGGEPSVQKDFLEFLEKCIEHDRTDIEIGVSTNAVSFSNRFKNAIEQFDNLMMVISIDGFEKVNEYSRWPTNWTKLNQNLNYLMEKNINIHFHVVISIYNISNLFELLGFLEPFGKKVILGIADASYSRHNDHDPDILSPWILPNREVVLENLKKVKWLDMYNNDKEIKETVDSFIDWYSIDREIKTETLTKFFNFNDRLDEIRGVKLADYIPELEQCRKSITKQI